MATDKSDKGEKQAAAPTTTDSTTEAKPKLASVPGGAAHRPRRERKMVELTNDLPPKWEPENEGDFIEGYWHGMKALKKGKNTFNTLRIRAEDGSIQSFAGAIPERMLSRFKLGTYVRVTFLGWKEASGGDARDFKIEYEEGAEILPEEDVAI